MDAAPKLALLSDEETPAFLRARAGTRQDFLRRMVEGILWLGHEQPADAIGYQHGIKTDFVYPLSRVTRDLYHLRAVPHTSTGKPALQLVLLDSWIGERHAREVPEPDQEMFKLFCDRLSKGKVVADWAGVNGGSFYAVAMQFRVHPSLLRAVTFNTSPIACQHECDGKCEPCPYRAERAAKFWVPDGWT